MKIVFIIHAEFEKPGHIADWAKRNNHPMQEVHTYKGEALPHVNDFDFLVVMGGPQSPLKIDQAPYLANEIELIKQAIAHQKRIMGVCLGAQLIAEALGAKTEQSPHREIGMYPIKMLSEAQHDPVFRHFPKQLNVMHWHSDMPGIAEGAVLLASSEGCPRQVFRHGDRIYGFQCHFEMTPELIEGMIVNCPEDLRVGSYIRSKEELLQSDCKLMNTQLEGVLDYMGSLSCI